MRTVMALALLVPLSLVGCKKKAEPEAAPVAEAPAPAPDVAWAFGPATYKGGRLDGDTGTLTIPVTATNNTDRGLKLDALRIAIKGADGAETCSAKESFTEKDAGGGTLSVSLDLACMYTALPAEGKLSAMVTAMYTLAGEAHDDKSDQMIKFQR